MTSTQSSTRKLFLLLGSVGLLAASFLLAAPQTASALPSQDCDCIYYSNASHTTEVGEREIFCNGQQFRSGTTSPYSSCFCTPC
jgi:hypothetical protein